MKKIWLFVIYGILGVLIVGLLLYALVPSFAKMIYDHTMLSPTPCCSCHHPASGLTGSAPPNAPDLIAQSGQVGDTFGGTIGPFVAIIASVLTFFAFYIQYEANEQQKKDLQVERFENKFYTMLEIHRDNVTELYIGKSTRDRKAFISMFNELKFAYYLVQEYYTKVYRKAFPNDALSEDARYNIAYLIFFFGIGPNSSPIVIDILGERYRGFFQCLEPWIDRHKTMWHEHRKIGETIHVNTSEGVYELDIKYKPFNGHMSKLSHYLRHLYQLMKFIDDADGQIFKRDHKYNYATTVRSQLSVHEQLLLYYNAVSILGKPWLDPPELMKNYCLIKSSALTLADFYKDPITVFGTSTSDGKPMFEWGEIKNRINNI